MRKKIYIAGPISKGNQFVNVAKAMDWWDLVRHRGFIPYCPHLTAFFEISGICELSHQEWLDYDFEWLRVCDGLLRMPGESKGADMEVAEAERLGIPVFHSLSELTSHVW